MFQNLSEKLESAFKNIKGQGRITDLNIANTIKDIRRALVDADVNYKIAKEFTDKVKDKAQVAKGKIKETTGKATGNRSLEAEGKGDKVSGNLKQAGEKVKDAVKPKK